MAKQPGMAARQNVDDLRYQLEDQQAEISKLNLALSQAHGELDTTRRQLIDKKAEYNAAEEKIQELSADVGKWKAAANRAGGGGAGGHVTSSGDPQAMKRMQDEISSLRSQLSNANRKLQERDQDLQREREQRPRTGTVLPDHYRIQLQHLQSENTHLQTEIRSLRDQLDQLRTHNSELLYQLQQQGDSGQSARPGEVDYLREENRRLQQDLDGIQSTNTALHQQILYHEDDFRREKAEREEANSRYKKAQEEIKELTETIKQLKVGNTPDRRYSESSDGGGNPPASRRYNPTSPTAGGGGVYSTQDFSSQYGYGQHDYSYQGRGGVARDDQRSRGGGGYDYP